MRLSMAQSRRGFNDQTAGIPRPRRATARWFNSERFLLRFRLRATHHWHASSLQAPYDGGSVGRAPAKGAPVREHPAFRTGFERSQPHSSGAKPRPP